MDEKLRTQLLPIYEQVGAVVQNSQHLEFSISFSLTMLKQLKSTQFTNEEFDGSMDFFSQKTFGRLIGEFKKFVVLDEVAVETMKKALDERNFIIHGLFNEMIGELATIEGREKVLARINTARSNMRHGFEILDSVVQFLLKESGLNIEEIVSDAKSHIEI